MKHMIDVIIDEDAFMDNYLWGEENVLIMLFIRVMYLWMFRVFILKEIGLNGIIGIGLIIISGVNELKGYTKGSFIMFDNPIDHGVIYASYDIEQNLSK